MEGIGNEQRLVKLFVLSPVDLAVSKVSRFSDADRSDIQALARDGHISNNAFKKRADEALDYYIGNKDSLARNVSTAIADIERHAPRNGMSSDQLPGMGIGV